MKRAPLLMMAALLLLGAWLVSLGHDVAVRPGATTYELQVASSRGVLEAAPGSNGEMTYRVVLREGHASPEMTVAEALELFGPGVVRAGSAQSDNFAFRLFRITNWYSLAWIAIGLTGQLAFSGRTLIQWIVSEKHRQSIVPPIFWWLSLGGGLMLFAYFVWRQDIVGVLGQSSGIVIYARNLRLIGKQKRREDRAAIQTPDA